MVEEELRESAKRDFQSYGRPLDTVAFFKYFRQIITASDDDQPAMVGNLSKSWKSWARLKRIMVRDGSRPRVPGMLLKAVLKAVLISGVETWVMTPRIGRSLWRFQNRVTR